MQSQIEMCPHTAMPLRCNSHLFNMLIYKASLSHPCDITNTSQQTQTEVCAFTLRMTTVSESVIWFVFFRASLHTSALTHDHHWWVNDLISRFISATLILKCVAPLYLWPRQVSQPFPSLFPKQHISLLCHLTNTGQLILLFADSSIHPQIEVFASTLPMTKASKSVI